MQKIFSDSDISREKRKVGYFSMEIGLDTRIPTYSGGLGILAGDTLKSCADLNVPIVGVTLLSRKGYFYQKIDQDGNQTENDVVWSVDDFLNLREEKVKVSIEGRDVIIQAWEYKIKGIKGSDVPVIFLDTNVEGNQEQDRRLTDKLYGIGDEYRIKQEVILGIGGARMLRALGYTNIQVYHMNEGHSALLTLELLKETEKPEEQDPTKRYDLEKVKRMCVFTTHTPVPAGHDKFEKDMVKRMLGDFIHHEFIDNCCYDGKFNMTHLALSHSHYINGVAKKHGEISRNMFPGYPVDSITNGVHLATWAGPSFQKLYDEHICGWRTDPFALRYALNLTKTQIWDAHMEEKRRLLDFINSKHNAGMDKDVLTIGFARRATSYKRPTLLFRDINRLKQIAGEKGRLQIIYGGKAHPNDDRGKELIKEINSLRFQMGEKISIVYVENYDIEKAKLMVSGVDVWLNTPLRPHEASGTSGMKAAANGVLNFSVLDGWWLEGHVENVTGWSIGPKKKEEGSVDDEDAEDLYKKLGEKIIPIYYTDRKNWIRMMRHSIAFNASFFNTHRMVQQYVMNAYFD